MLDLFVHLFHFSGPVMINIVAALVIIWKSAGSPQKTADAVSPTGTNRPDQTTQTYFDRFRRYCYPDCTTFDSGRHFWLHKIQHPTLDLSSRLPDILCSNHADIRHFCTTIEVVQESISKNPATIPKQNTRTNRCSSTLSVNKKLNFSLKRTLGSFSA